MTKHDWKIAIIIAVCALAMFGMLFLGCAGPDAEQMPTATPDMWVGMGLIGTNGEAVPIELMNLDFPDDQPMLVVGATNTRIPFKNGTPAPPGLLGVCHACQGSVIGISYVSWCYDSGLSYFWESIEPSEDTYNFTPIAQSIATVQTAGKKVWIQVMSNSPGSWTTPTATHVLETRTAAPFTPVAPLPLWAKNAGVDELPNCSRSNPYCSSYTRAAVVPWDPDYQSHWADLMEEMANEFDNNPSVEAVLMMAGGNYGEMSQSAAVCYSSSDPNSDVKNPNHPMIKSMATSAATLIGGDTVYDLTQPYTDGDGTYWVAKYDYYYYLTVKNLIDIYMQYWISTPVVVQLGSGISCQTTLPMKVAEYAATTYPKRVWLKQNGWGNDTTSGYNGIFDLWDGYTRTGFEAGQPGRWCDKELNGTPINSGYSCEIVTPEYADRKNATIMAGSADSNISFACVQSNQLTHPEVYKVAPTEWYGYSLQLATPYTAYLSLETPTPGVPIQTPTFTPTPTGTWATTAPTDTPAATNTPTVTPTIIGAVTLDYTSLEDTWLVGTDPDGNWSSYQFFTTNYINDLQRGLLRWDLSSIPAGSTINSATMYLFMDNYYYSIYPGNVTFDLHYVTKNWVNAEATWNEYASGSSWDTAGGDYGALQIRDTTPVGDPVQPKWIDFNVTNMVSDWVNGIVTNNGMLIRSPTVYEFGPGSNIPGSGKFRSAEYWTTSYRPYLYIVYSYATPTPTATATNTPTSTPTAVPATPFMASEDTWAYSGTANTNYSTHANLYVNSATNYKSFVQFDLSLIPPGSTINSAILYTYVYSRSGNVSLGVGAHEVLKDAALTELTWNAYRGWNLANADLETAGGGGADVFASWNEVASDGSIVRDTSNQRTGAACAAITAGASADTYIYQNKATTENTTYTTGFWARGDGTHSPRYAIYDATHTAYITAITDTGITGTSYTWVPVEFTTPAGCISVSIVLICPDTNTGIAYFDDVFIGWDTAGAEAITDRAVTPEAIVTMQADATWYQWPIPLMVKKWVDTPADNHGANLEADGTPGAAVLFYMYSQENPVDGTKQPYLAVSYWTPTPTPTHTPTVTNTPTETLTPTPTATWTPTATYTPTNTPLPRVLINEVFPEPTSVDLVGTGNYTDTAFIELYNNTGAYQDLSWSRLVVTNTNGTSVEFNGTTSSINAGSDTGLDDLADNAFTVEGWFNPDTPGEGNAGRFFGKANTASVGWYANTTADLYLFARVNCATTDAQTLTSTSIVTDTWQHIAITYDDAGDRKVHFWIDGVEAGYTTDTACLGDIVSDADYNMYIGNRADGGGVWDGSVGWGRVSDSVRYTGAFSPTDQIAPPVLDANTVATWRMTEGAGTAVDNIEGTAARDLTLSNTTWNLNTNMITYTLPYSTGLDAGGFLPFYYRDTKLPLIMKNTGHVYLYVWQWVDPEYTLVLTDTVAMPGPTPDYSYARYSDGAGWQWLEWESPGQSNAKATPTPTRTPTATYTPTSTATATATP